MIGLAEVYQTLDALEAEIEYSPALRPIYLRVEKEASNLEDIEDRRLKRERSRSG